MARFSQIDETIPVAGNPTTASVRTNFAILKQEVTELLTMAETAPFLPLSGGAINGDLTIVQPDYPQIAFSRDGIPANGLWIWRDGNSLVLGDDASWEGKFDVTGLTVAQVVLGRDPTAPLEAVTKQYVDGAVVELRAAIAALKEGER